MTQNTRILTKTAVRNSYLVIMCEYLKSAFRPSNNDKHGTNSVQHSTTVWNIPWSMYKWTWFVTWGCHRATHKATHSGLKAYFTARDKNPCRYITSDIYMNTWYKVAFLCTFNKTLLAWCQKSIASSLSAFSMYLQKYILWSFKQCYCKYTETGKKKTMTAVMWGGGNGYGNIWQV